MDLVTSETAARMMPGDESISGMADPTQEGISTSSSSSTTNVIFIFLSEGVFLGF